MVTGQTRRAMHSTHPTIYQRAENKDLIRGQIRSSPNDNSRPDVPIDRRTGLRISGWSSDFDNKIRMTKLACQRIISGLADGLAIMSVSQKTACMDRLVKEI